MRWVARCGGMSEVDRGVALPLLGVRAACASAPHAAGDHGDVAVSAVVGVQSEAFLRNCLPDGIRAGVDPVAASESGGSMA